MSLGLATKRLATVVEVLLLGAGAGDFFKSCPNWLTISSMVSNFLDSLACFSLDNKWSVSLMQTKPKALVATLWSSALMALAALVMDQQSLSISSAFCMFGNKVAFFKRLTL